MTASTRALPLAPSAAPSFGVLRFLHTVWTVFVEARSLQREMMRRYPGIPQD